MMAIRFRALALAIVHYGLANLSKESRPAAPDTVLKAAATFEDYLTGAKQHPRTETPAERRDGALNDAL